MTLVSIQDKAISSSYINGKGTQFLSGPRKEGQANKNEARIVRNMSSYAASAMIDLSNGMQEIQFLSIGRSALKITGIIGESVNLTCDTAQLTYRCQAHYKITKMLENTSIDSLAYTVLKKRQRYVEKLIAINAAAVAVDAISTAISAGAPIVSFPVSVVSFLISIGRIFGEKSINRKLKKSLHKTIRSYERHHDFLIKHENIFRNKHAVLQYQYDQIKNEKEMTANTLENELYKYRNPHQSGGIVKLSDGRTSVQKATDDDVQAETAFKDIEQHWHESCKDLRDLEGYFMAKQLIALIDPLLNMKMHLEKRKQEFEETYEQTYGKQFQSYEQTYGRLMIRDGVDIYEMELNKRLQVAEKTSSDIHHRLCDLNDTLIRQNSDLEHLDRSASDLSVSEYRGAMRLYEIGIPIIEKEQHGLKNDKHHWEIEIAKIKKEQKALKAYMKTCEDLESLKDDIRHKKVEKLHTKAVRARMSLSVHKT